MLAVVSIVLLSSIVISTMTFYSFSLSAPEEVAAQPGSTVTVDGKILVTGMYWLHNFDLKIDGISYNYTINPAHWEDVPILRSWNPQQGVYREPENFTISINVPSDAYGVQIVTITGQEHHSFREVSNSTFFVLKVGGKAPEIPVGPQRAINITDILVPETIQEGEQFNITFLVSNEGANKTAVAISVLAPSDWTVEQKTQYLQVAANDSAAGVFKMTPTASAGTVSLYLEYPYKQEIINFTREGPYLQPATTTSTTETTTTTTERPLIVEFYENAKAKIVEFVTGIWGSITEAPVPMLTPFTLGIIAVLLVIIVWLVWGIIKDYRSAAGKTEEMKKQKIETVDALNGIEKL